MNKFFLALLVSQLAWLVGCSSPKYVGPKASPTVKTNDIQIRPIETPQPTPVPTTPKPNPVVPQSPPVHIPPTEFDECQPLENSQLPLPKHCYPEEIKKPKKRLELRPRKIDNKKHYHPDNTTVIPKRSSDPQCSFSSHFARIRTVKPQTYPGLSFNYEIEIHTEQSFYNLPNVPTQKVIYSTNVIDGTLDLFPSFGMNFPSQRFSQNNCAGQSHIFWKQDLNPLRLLEINNPDQKYLSQYQMGDFGALSITPEGKLNYLIFVIKDTVSGMGYPMYYEYSAVYSADPNYTQPHSDHRFSALSDFAIYQPIVLSSQPVNSYAEAEQRLRDYLNQNSVCQSSEPIVHQISPEDDYHRIIIPTKPGLQQQQFQQTHVVKPQVRQAQPMQKQMQVKPIPMNKQKQADCNPLYDHMCDSVL